ncbi:MAG: hypothetical protein H6908_01585 [Hyphomicrobiales bacterium]|nr:hypothetical protein [Rickettsiales bacterium]MCP5361325.1 hypothetical protein [Hyphomicrobiales bacterium]
MADTSAERKKNAASSEDEAKVIEYSPSNTVPTKLIILLATGVLLMGIGVGGGAYYLWDQRVQKGLHIPDITPLESALKASDARTTLLENALAESQRQFALLEAAIAQNHEALQSFTGPVVTTQSAQPASLPLLLAISLRTRWQLALPIEEERTLLRDAIRDDVMLRSALRELETLLARQMPARAALPGQFLNALQETKAPSTMQEMKPEEVTQEAGIFARLKQRVLAPIKVHKVSDASTSPENTAQQDAFLALQSSQWDAFLAYATAVPSPGPALQDVIDAVRYYRQVDQALVQLIRDAAVRMLSQVEPTETR